MSTTYAEIAPSGTVHRIETPSSKRDHLRTPCGYPRVRSGEGLTSFPQVIGTPPPSRPRCGRCFPGWTPPEDPRRRARDRIEVVARTVNDLGWTCEAHEPLAFGECSSCEEGQRRLARASLDALAVLDGEEHP